ncbi:TIGR01777 family oxidoreductase [Listeria valentina]|uniref:TIGR01777 family oxidoreductase n=1 Tax=Listeria valentina TaxID=2705293 RepID=UPI001431D6E4|nr:TIGR01777 family oxidoreductase [Listeria valentina]
MNILIAGGTGFIGRWLTKSYMETGDQVYILTREKRASFENVHFIQWLQDDTSLPDLSEIHFDLVVNLAGANLATKRWTARRKKEIVDSRIQATAALLAIIKRQKQKPEVWINASAIGGYPPSYTEIYSDYYREEHPKRASFLGRTVTEWEKTAAEVEKLGIRLVVARFGLVLGREGGAFPSFEKVFRSGLGGKFGTGDMWYSWIHIDDLVRAIRFVASDESLTGIVHFTSPHPTQEKQFAEKLAKRLHRPSLFTIPEVAIKLALGDKAAAILDSHRVYPEQLVSHHFEFYFDTVDLALSDLID